MVQRDIGAPTKGDIFLSLFLDSEDGSDDDDDGN